jgi:hypothetical protein
MLPSPETSASPEAADRTQSKANPQRSGPSGPLQGQKSLFRVPMYRSSGTGQSNRERSTERVYHARRPHRKSRSGCLTCKRRRVKVRYLPVSFWPGTMEYADGSSAMRPNLTACDARNMALHVYTPVRSAPPTKRALFLYSLRKILSWYRQALASIQCISWKWQKK